MKPPRVIETEYPYRCRLADALHADDKLLT